MGGDGGDRGGFDHEQAGGRVGAVLERVLVGKELAAAVRLWNVVRLLALQTTRSARHHHAALRMLVRQVVGVVMVVLALALELTVILLLQLKQLINM